MQETRNILTDEIRQRIFSAETSEALIAAMDADLRKSEELIRRVELDPSTIHALNRHERRKAAALARRAK